jgi:hypothetical protein
VCAMTDPAMRQEDGNDEEVASDLIGFILGNNTGRVRESSATWSRLMIPSFISIYLSLFCLLSNMLSFWLK